MRPRGEVLAELALLDLILDELDRLPAAVMWPQWCTDEWERWQQGGCLTYAKGLMQLDPSLRFVVAGFTFDGDPLNGWHPAHFYVHDGKVAYDSAGQHPMPYRGLADDMDYFEAADPQEWDDDEEPVEDAVAHAVRNSILEGRYPLTGGRTCHAAAVASG